MSNTSSLFPSQGDALIKNQNLSDLSNAVTARGNLNKWVTKTAAYTAVDGDWIRAHTSGGAFTITLPASPADGAEIRIYDTGYWAINNLTIARNGKTIKGLSEDIVCQVGGVGHTFKYVATDGNWEVISNAVTTGDAGQAWTLIETQTANNDSSLDFTTGLSTDYSTFRIEFNRLLPATDNTAIGFRLSDDGGATWASGASAYYSTVLLMRSNATTIQETTDDLMLLTSSLGNVAGTETGLCGHITIYGLNDATVRTWWSGEVVYKNQNTTFYHGVGGGELLASNADDAVQLIANGGNLLSGTVKIYGVK
jgi:hypothetical protein